MFLIKVANIQNQEENLTALTLQESQVQNEQVEHFFPWNFLPSYFYLLLASGLRGI